MRTISMLTLAATLCAASPATAQSPVDRQQARVAELLQRSPLLAPRSGVSEDARFVREAREALAAAGEAAVVGSPEDATRALEDVLRETTVRATVRSTPTQLVVTYRRLVDLEAQEVSVTTDQEIPLRPALYLFRAVDPRSGRVQEQRRACATDCSVFFRFP